MMATAHLRAFLKARHFDAGLIDRIADEAEHSRSSYVWRRYAPALGMTGSLLEFFAEPPIVWFVDGEGVNRVLGSLARDFARNAQRAEDEFPPLALAIRPSVDRARARPRSSCTGAGDARSHRTQKRTADRSRHRREQTIKFQTAAHPSVVGKLDPLLKQIRSLGSKGVETMIYSETPTQRERLADMLGEDEMLVHLPVGWIASGFIWEQAGLAILTDHQIFNRMLARPRKKRATRRATAVRTDSLQGGDYVVHVDYGIGRFVGLEKIDADDSTTECIALRFDGGDRIFVRSTNSFG
jgi:transcription-repair coupling factor (superfamily II helicase)